MATNDRPDALGVQTFAHELPGPRAIDHATDQQREDAGRNSGPQVRSYRLLDSSSISNLPYRYELHHPESDVDQPRTLQLMSRRILSGENPTRPLFVAQRPGGHALAGALQCQQQGADDRWYLQYLATAEPVEPENPTAVALLEHAIAEAGWWGSRRLMARSETESPVSGALRSVGFTAFCHEYVFTSPTMPTGDLPRMVRAQESSDVWGIHQLYLQTTPRDVQNAEALTSHEWDVDLEGRSRRGWFVASGGIPSVYLRVRTSRRHHRVDAMFAPGARSQLSTLLGAVFSVLQTEAPRPIYVSMRGYQQELESVLEEYGFHIEADQLMMVRYTTVAVPSRITEGFELLPARESDPQRVPSFYMREPNE